MMLKKILSAFALLGFLLATTTYVQASEVLNSPGKTTAKKKAEKPKAKSGAQAKFIPGSQETKKERSARLTRECKGEVNAGACTGYTR